MAQTRWHRPIFFLGCKRVVQSGPVLCRTVSVALSGPTVASSSAKQWPKKAKHSPCSPSGTPGRRDPNLANSSRQRAKILWLDEWYVRCKQGILPILDLSSLLWAIELNAKVPEVLQKVAIRPSIHPSSPDYYQHLSSLPQSSTSLFLLLHHPSFHPYSVFFAAICQVFRFIDTRLLYRTD